MARFRKVIDKTYLNVVFIVKKVIQLLVILPIMIYRLLISPLLGPRCRFYPTCSSYAIEAIKVHGALFGLFLMVKRLLKCHPYHPGGYDPVPKPTCKNRRS